MADTTDLSLAVTRPVWLEGISVTDREAMPGDCSADVAIIGGGLSGLWTAYYLHKLDPSLRIAIVEREYCGFGASGRNGGWAVGELACGYSKYAALSSDGDARRLIRAVFATIDDVGRVAEELNIECGFAKGGWIRLARNKPQAKRQAEEIAEIHNEGLTEDDIRLLTAGEASEHLNATKVEGGIYFEHCAALNPAQLAFGLADRLANNGVSVFERTEVKAIERGGVQTNKGYLKADIVIRATEAYTRDLKGQRRRLLPVYSLMVASEPLSDEVFQEIGLGDRQTFSDDRHTVIYGQRTADNRLAFGGRGVPYLYGSKIRAVTENHLLAHELIRKTLVDMLPVLADVRFTHRWGGVLGIPRDWVPGLIFDADSGHGSLGGYVGEGVAASHLAGQTMAELVTETDSERTTLPWVGVQARRWEPEPFRWLGVRSSRWLFEWADNYEYRTDKEARTAERVSRLLRGA